MKARKVIVAIELTTSLSVKELRDPKLWEHAGREPYVLCVCNDEPWIVGAIEVKTERDSHAKRENYPAPERWATDDSREKPVRKRPRLGLG